MPKPKCPECGGSEFDGESMGNVGGVTIIYCANCGHIIGVVPLQW
jgi:uncharacterized Zn finger protein